MKSRFPSAIVGIAIAGLLVPASASAATNGSFGSTSTGNVNINASVPNRVRLSGLTDVSLLNLDPTVDATSAQNVCVFSNTATRGYSITATGSGAASAFTLSAGASTVPYSVEWSDTVNAASGSGLTAGTAGTGFTSTATHQLCNTGPSASASLVVKLASADLSSMQAGQTYTGTLTLLVQPE